MTAQNIKPVNYAYNFLHDRMQLFNFLQALRVGVMLCARIWDLFTFRFVARMALHFLMWESSCTTLPYDQMYSCSGFL